MRLVSRGFVPENRKLRRAFEQRGAKVECLNFKFEDTPEGKFIETIIAAQGALEREQNGRQVRQKMEERLKKGYWPFSAPVGYRYCNTREHGRLLTRDEPIASVVQEALEGFATGRFTSQAEVQRFLQDNPIYPKGASGRIHPQRITDIMTRPVYAGLVEYKPWGVALRQGHHEPIIRAKTYDTIQDIRAGVKRMTTRSDIGRDFILRGAVCCADCGVPYRSAWSKGKNKHYAYYVCQTKDCDSYGKSVPRDTLEAAFEALLRKITPSQDLFRLARKMLKDIWDQNLAGAANAKQALKAQIKQAEAQSQKLLDKIIAAENPAILAALEQKFGDLTLSKSILEEKLENTGKDHVSFEEALEHVMNFLSNPWKLWEKGSFEVRRAILKLVLVRPFHYHRKTGPRTPEIAFPFKALGEFGKGNINMVRSGGLEPPRVLPHSDLNAARLPIPPRPHVKAGVLVGV